MIIKGKSRTSRKSRKAEHTITASREHVRVRACVCVCVCVYVYVCVWGGVGGPMAAT